MKAKARKSKPEMKAGDFVIVPHEDGSSIGRIAAIERSMAHVKPYTGCALRVITPVRFLKPVPYRINIGRAS